MKKLIKLAAVSAFGLASIFVPQAFPSHAYADGDNHEFNGKAWFVWNCNDGDLCRFQITGLTEAEINPTTGDVSYDTKYIPASDVTDGTTTLDLDALLALEAAHPNTRPAPYLFIYDDCLNGGGTADATCIEGISDLDTWAELEEWWDNHITSYDEQQAFAIDPTGASSGKNIISTNGNRRFRATIYNEDKYYGVSNASTTADLTYYPLYWDTGMFNPAYDVSETTASNPQIIQSFLLEPEVILSSDNISSAITSISIASANVPDRAVTITPLGGGQFKLKFNSSFYDKVVFRITSGAKNYYVGIARTVVGHSIEEGYERQPVAYVKSTDTSQYDMIATYYFADGSEQTYTLERSHEGNGGKGLKAITYLSAVQLRPGLPNSPVGVSYTVTKSGSTPANYQGTLGGSNKGTYYKVSNTGSLDLDITK